MKNCDVIEKLKELYLKADAIRAELEELEADYRNVEIQEGELDLYVELSTLSSGATDFATSITDQIFLYNVNEKSNEATS